MHSYFSPALLKELPKDSESFHQEILTVTYSDWQKNSENWSYNDLINNTITKYGELAALAVLLGKYNQQVTNGGHSQYYDNGYASVNSHHLRDTKRDTDLHMKMITLFDKFDELYNLKNTNKVMEILKDFILYTDEPGHCYDCNGEGGFYDEDANYEACDNCQGTGIDESGHCDMSYLDSQYFKINEEWMSELEDFFRQKLLT